jgi:hypothetical protein
LSTRLSVCPDELAEKKRHVAVPRHLAKRRQIEPHLRVGKAVVPAGQLGVVVAGIVDVPAEDDVAEAEAALHRRVELVPVQILPAQHAVDVADGDLDLGELRARDGIERAPIGRSRSLSRGHASSPLVVLRMLRSCRPRGPGGAATA